MPAKPPITVASAPVKVPVKKAMAQIKQAIRQGKQAVAASTKAVKAKPKDAKSIAALDRNKDLLAKAEFILHGLEASEVVANMMCPQQTANLMFDYE